MQDLHLDTNEKLKVEYYLTQSC